MRVLDAFRPRGAGWSGQVISPPPGPSGGPSKMHLLPSGGVPRVHRAQSPVPPRLPRFATPRSVHQFAAVAAGAYPLRRPPNAWSPGEPALPGPCYWLVASGTPLGWRGGCLAWGLGRGAVRHYCLGGCSAPSVCARRSRPVWGAQAGRWCCISPVSPFTPRVSRAACGGPSRPGVPYPRSPVRHSTRSVRSASLVRVPFWYSLRALCVCVRSRSRGVRSPLPWVVWRAHLARSRHWALVGPLHVIGVPPRVLPWSLALSGALGGGAVRSRFPPTWLGLHAPWGLRAAGVAAGRPRGGGVACNCFEGRLVSGAVPAPTARPLGRAAGVLQPVCSGCGRCGRGDPAPAPQRAPLRAGVARCGGGGTASPGGVPSTAVRGVWCQALFLPRPPVLWGGHPGFRNPCVPGAVGAGVGTQQRPHSVRPCGPALLAAGVAEEHSRVGAFHRCEQDLWSGAPPP